MRNIAKIASKDREALFRNTAAKMGLNEAIIEKDETVLVGLVDDVLLDPNNTDALKEIDNLVYKIYGLTEEEIAVVEATIK